MELFAHPYCPNCGHRFSHKIKSDGKLKGGLSGAAAGAILGGKVGIAMGTLGAMAGTLPGAVLGGVFGNQIGNKFDSPTCTKCNFKFKISDTIRKWNYKLEDRIVTKKNIITDKAKTARAQEAAIEELPKKIQLLFKQNRAFEIAELLFEYLIDGKDKYVNEVLNKLKLCSPEFAKKTEMIFNDLKSRMGL